VDRPDLLQLVTRDGLPGGVAVGQMLIAGIAELNDDVVDRPGEPVVVEGGHG
jgi:hypothetical protein